MCDHALYLKGVILRIIPISEESAEVSIIVGDTGLDVFFDNGAFSMLSERYNVLDQIAIGCYMQSDRQEDGETTYALVDSLVMPNNLEKAEYYNFGKIIGYIEKIEQHDQYKVYYLSTEFSAMRKKIKAVLPVVFPADDLKLECAKIGRIMLAEIRVEDFKRDGQYGIYLKGVSFDVKENENWFNNALL